MKTSEILKAQGLMSKDIKARFAAGQVSLNGQVLKADTEIPSVAWQDSGTFLMSLCTNPIWAAQLKIFGLETLIGGDFSGAGASELASELRMVLANKAFLKFSKRESIILELTSNK